MQGPPLDAACQDSATLNKHGQLAVLSGDVVALDSQTHGPGASRGAHSLDIDVDAQPHADDSDKVNHVDTQSVVPADSLG